MLNPAWLREVLGKLTLRYIDNLRLIIKQNSSTTAGALIKRDNELIHILLNEVFMTFD